MPADPTPSRTPLSATVERTCPHCDGSGKGPQTGAWGALLTAGGVLPVECQNCDGTGKIAVARCGSCDGEYVPKSKHQALCSACTYISAQEGHRVR